MSISLIIIIFIVSSQQYGLIGENKPCRLVDSISFGDLYSVKKLKCDWQRFVEYLHKNKDYKVEKKDVYEIEFELKDKLIGDQINYNEVRGNLFEVFSIRSLSLRGLGLRSLNRNAFKKCCENSLEYLDLSGNQLKRVDRSALSRLQALQVLNLTANPQIQFANDNFYENSQLKQIYLASNNIEYLPEKIFNNLHRLSVVDLSNNNLRNVDACTFYPVYDELEATTTNKGSFKQQLNASSVSVNLQTNPIECNCDVFYLERAANLKLDLVCNGDEPEFYKNKHISQLSRENPENLKCFYSQIEFNCRSKYVNANNLLSNYETFKILVILFSVLLSILFLVVICTCCQICTLRRKYKTSKSHLRTASVNKKIDEHKQVNTNNAAATTTTNAKYTELQNTAE